MSNKSDLPLSIIKLLFRNALYMYIGVKGAIEITSLSVYTMLRFTIIEIALSNSAIGTNYC